MKARWVITVIPAALALGAGAWWAARSPGEPATDRASTVAAASPPVSGAPLLPPSPLEVAVPVEAAAEPAVALAPDAVLARVNGVELRLGDLMTVEPGAREAPHLPPAQVRYLLDRAIDRELVGQAARAAGVTLDEQQAQQLATVRDQLAVVDDGVRELTRSPAYVAFDVRDTEGLMLQANLVARAGLPSEHVTPADVDAHYRAHQAEYAPLPADPAARAEAWRQIDGAIREQLALAQVRRHGEAVAAFLRDLRDRADVDESALIAGLR